MANQNPTGTPTAKLSDGKFNTPIIFGNTELLQGITDADNDPLRVSLVAAEHGEISDNNNGTFTFLPDNGFTGAVTLDYVISDDNDGELNAMQTFNISAANQIPTGNATAKLAIGKINTPYSINAADLLIGFLDANNDPLRVALVTAENGEITDNNNGTFTFSPENGFTGAVTLDYVISDDNGGEISATQSFNLTAGAVASDSSINHAPTGSATAKLANGKINTAYILNHAHLLEGFTDADNDALRVVLVTAENGEIIDNNNGTFTFSPDKDTSGLITLDYIISDDKGGEISATQKFSIGDAPSVVIPITPDAIEPVYIPDVVAPQPTVPKIKINGKTEQGDSSNNLIIGTGKNDKLSGMAGADTLRGNAGDDLLDGGAGNDALDSGNGNDVLTGGDGNDKLLSGSGNDYLTGDAGNDTLDAGAGKDTLNGGAGVDSMTGGDGDDYYFVDNSQDKVVETNKSVILGGKDTVKATSSYTLGVNIENLILDDPQGKGYSGTGNKSDNVITGNIGDDSLNGVDGNDKLNGGEGDDTLDGGLGMDTLIGGNGSDVYFMNNLDDKIIENENGGEQDQIIAKVDFDLAQSENVEVLTLSGKKAINGTGDDFNNLLQEIDGGNVANIFDGKKGNDVILGEGGNDTLQGGEGDDELDGGEGKDTAIFTGISDDYQITHNPDVDGVAQLVVEYKGNDSSINDGKDILTNIEVLQFAEGETINASTLILTGMAADA